jgi:hypothetical protein
MVINFLPWKFFSCSMIFFMEGNSLLSRLLFSIFLSYSVEQLTFMIIFLSLSMYLLLNLTRAKILPAKKILFAEEKNLLN